MFTSFFGQDDIVTGEDKQQILYYLHFPVKLSGRWNLSLRRNGPQGPEICKIHKGGWSNSFSIYWDTGAETPCQNVGNFRVHYEFPASSERYRWDPDGLIMTDYHYSLYKAAELELPRTQRTLIARWRTSVGSFTKDGRLELNPQYTHELELILATALGLEERCRERR
ncbi:hypothetical protein JCM8202_001751 [Rhodotorula sphaerocarpa]